MRLRQNRLIVGTLGLFLTSAVPLAGQSTTSSPAPQGEKEDSAMKRAITGVFNAPLHPVIKGVASGGGIGGGLQYDFPARGRWEASARAIVTLRRYWLAELTSGYDTDRLRTEAYARIRDMNSLNFFGPGTNSLNDDRTTFTLRDPVVGAVGSVDVVSGVAIGGRVETFWSDVSPGRSTTNPSIETRFSEKEAPGLTAQPRYVRYQPFVELAAPADVGWGFNQGGRYRLAYAVFNDVELDRFDFRRLELEGRHKFAMFIPYHSLTLHGWVSTTDTSAGRDVPFFLQHTLGGTGNLRSVDEDLIGSDGTRATLRGFRSYRFRDRHLLLLQAEYRLDIWGPLEATAFVDAGKVAPRRSELNVSDLRRNYGFSISLMRGASALARVDVGFGGGEGVHVMLKAMK